MERVVARLGTYLRRHDDYDKYVSSTVACAPPGQDSGPVHAEVLTPPRAHPVRCGVPATAATMPHHGVACTCGHTICTV